jgi:hypothetical protein
MAVPDFVPEVSCRQSVPGVCVWLGSMVRGTERSCQVGAAQFFCLSKLSSVKYLSNDARVDSACMKTSRQLHRIEEVTAWVCWQLALYPGWPLKP